MSNRRTFIKSAGLAAAATGLAGTPEALALALNDKDKTWLTYAVNVEMFWSRLPFAERLRKVADAGFTHYEFWQWRNKNIDEVASVSKDLGLKPVQFTGYWGITDPAKKGPFVQAIKDALPVAKKLGVDKLCVVAGEETPGLSRPRQFEAVIDALKAGGEIARDAGVTIILEPLNVLVDHPKQLVVTTNDALEVMEGVNSPNVKILFDCYHQQISEGNLSGNIKRALKHIGYFQLADHPGRFQPGTGEVNYAHVLRLIHDLGYQGVIGLEMRPKGDPFAALKELRACDEAAKSLIRAS